MRDAHKYQCRLQVYFLIGNGRLVPWLKKVRLCPQAFVMSGVRIADERSNREAQRFGRVQSKRDIMLRH